MTPLDRLGFSLGIFLVQVGVPVVIIAAFALIIARGLPHLFGGLING